jgi:esterase/lipase
MTFLRTLGENEMRVIHIVAGLWLGALASTALACELPPLVVIPPKDKVGDQAAVVRDATKTYFDQMKVYTDCVQAELTAAGGNNAPTVMKTVLIARNNAAVAEADAVKKLYDASVGPAVVPASQFNQDKKK